MVLWGILSLNPVILFGAARINGWDGLSALPQFLLALLTQVLFKQCCVAGVGTEQGISQITKERNQPNGKIENDVDQHLHSDRGRETSFYLATCPVHHESHKGIERIASTVMKSVTDPHLIVQDLSGVVKMYDLRRDQTDDAAPAEANSKKVEETHVKTICASLDLCQDLAIVL